ncbi:hypothetical protein [Streptomyces violaceusniger]|uniref:Uncharacterized protein n=1 Tax=Streptomyces violaceusniger (strain Tu 4113) TaxID=653045 RepID=G2PHN9_STRV4|nr:hypothetical protein [Streptomyces violaceusniger]AEM88840.1 hypothetical protein Strvi_0064 [Streptomyces violaceusniger Tu 4113]
MFKPITDLHALTAEDALYVEFSMNGARTWEEYRYAPSAPPTMSGTAARDFLTGAQHSGGRVEYADGAAIIRRALPSGKDSLHVWRLSLIAWPALGCTVTMRRHGAPEHLSDTTGAVVSTPARGDTRLTVDGTPWTFNIPREEFPHLYTWEYADESGAHSGPRR